MAADAYRLALALVVLAALGRFTGILLLKLRQGRYARRALAYPRGWRDLCTAPEPYLLGLTTAVLLVSHELPAAPTPAALVRAAAAALLALVAIALMLWVLRVFPSVSTGHYVLPGQRVITHGPYSLVRHPLYLAAFLIWFALSLAFASPLALALTLLYVIPSYGVYLRSEEAMLTAQLGDAYRSYRERVGGLLPRWPAHGHPAERRSARR